METQVRIIQNNEDWTNRIKDWTLYFDNKRGNIAIKMIFPSGKFFYSDLSRCRITPERNVVLDEDECLILKDKMSDDIHSAKVYGEKYVVISFLNNKQPYVYLLSDVKRIQLSTKKHKSKLDYFKYVAKIKDRASNDIPPILEGQLAQMKVRKDSALHAYLEKASKPLNDSTNLIYPFGLNLSQIEAVESAFSSQVSIIEGPPGTGKTQTILNIIANITLKNKTAAIVSSNNEAVQNVKEKMEKHGYGFLLASLGSRKNKQAFFNELPVPPEDFGTWDVESEEKKDVLSQISGDVEKIKALFHMQNEKARIDQQLKELKTERKYYEKKVSVKTNIKLKILPFLSFDK